MRLARLAALSLAFAASVALGSSAAAQCPTAVSIGPYGTGCNPAGFDVPALKAAYDTNTCQLAMKWSGNPGCCNTFLTGRLLIAGFQQAAIPAPGAGCTLLVTPTIVQFVPASLDNFQVKLPAVPSTVQVFVQIANQYTTFGVQNDYNLSNGVAMKIA